MECRPSLLGILVYSEFTSNVPIMGLVKSFRFSIFEIKSLLSFMYESAFLVKALGKISSKDDIFSVAQLLADTMGLPGGGLLVLCILGKNYVCGVRTCLTRRLSGTRDYFFLSYHHVYQFVDFMLVFLRQVCFCFDISVCVIELSVCLTHIVFGVLYDYCPCLVCGFYCQRMVS